MFMIITKRNKDRVSYTQDLLKLGDIGLIKKQRKCKEKKDTIVWYILN